MVLPCQVTLALPVSTGGGKSVLRRMLTSVSPEASYLGPSRLSSKLYLREMVTDLPG